ncbi:MAG: hypothetical protein IPQ04_03545 [Saprospiraceae bacterium]|nr:hypothetical protein [Saprospiraceae bacterium]
MKLSVLMFLVQVDLQKKVNAGKILRSGHELTFDFTPLKQRNIEWIASLNLGKNKTEVDELFEGVDAFLVENGASAGRGGVQIVHQTKQSWGQIRGGGILKDNNGNWILDDSGLPQQVANALLGSVLPDFTGGLQNTLKYKKFSITANIDFQKGGKFFSLSDQFGSFSGLMERTAALNDKGIPVRDAVADGGGVRVDGVNAAGERVTKYIDAQTYYHNFLIEELRKRASMIYLSSNLGN